MASVGYLAAEQKRDVRVLHGDGTNTDGWLHTVARARVL
jgi:hypothetical protein